MGLRPSPELGQILPTTERAVFSPPEIQIGLTNGFDCIKNLDLVFFEIKDKRSCFFFYFFLFASCEVGPKHPPTVVIEDAAMESSIV